MTKTDIKNIHEDKMDCDCDMAVETEGECLHNHSLSHLCSMFVLCQLVPHSSAQLVYTLVKAVLHLI